jgi:16S rRNA (cytosine967-C5)-methyltransferase
MAVSPARAAAFDVLLRVETQDAYAADLLHSALLDALSAADRNLATGITMGVLRWRSRLDAALAAAAARDVAKLDAEVLAALRMAAYQLTFLDRVPASAAVNESVELVKRARKRSAVPFANAVLRKLAAAPQSIAPPAEVPQTAAALAEALAHPAWLVERWVERFGMASARRICAWDQAVPPAGIRLHDAAAEAELRDAGIKLAPGALLTSTRRVVSGDMTRTAAFREGRVFLQDEASQLVALLVGRGARLLDCCAAPGGKTALLAARNPGSVIVAADLHPHRVRLLRRRVAAANVEVITADARALPAAEPFDRVLADVPCSGTGTLARNPEIKWRLQPDALAGLAALQREILSAALQQVAPGGRLLYSTCSLEREENDAVVEAVLAQNPRFSLVPVREELERLKDEGEMAWADLDSLTRGPFLQILPGAQPGDGFFAAVVAVGS